MLGLLLIFCLQSALPSLQSHTSVHPCPNEFWISGCREHDDEVIQNCQLYEIYATPRHQRYIVVIRKVRRFQWYTWCLVTTKFRKFDFTGTWPHGHVLGMWRWIAIFGLFILVCEKGHVMVTMWALKRWNVNIGRRWLYGRTCNHMTEFKVISNLQWNCDRHVVKLRW